MQQERRKPTKKQVITQGRVAVGESDTHKRNAGTSLNQTDTQPLNVRRAYQNTMDIHIKDAIAALPGRATRNGNSRAVTIPPQYADHELLIIIKEKKA